MNATVIADRSVIRQRMANIIDLVILKPSVRRAIVAEFASETVVEAARDIVVRNNRKWGRMDTDGFACRNP